MVACCPIAVLAVDALVVCVWTFSVGVCVCVRALARTHVRARTQTRTAAHTELKQCLRVRLCVRVCACVCVRLCVRVRACVRLSHGSQIARVQCACVRV